MDLFTQQILPFLLLLLCGSVGGFLAGLLGVGGGMLFIPVINEYLSNYPLTTDELVKYTLANSIALVFMSGVSGIFRQKKMGTWDWKQSLYIGIPGAISSLAMSMAIEQGDWYSKTRFQTVFLGFLLLSIGNMIWGKTALKTTAHSPPDVCAQAGWGRPSRSETRSGRPRLDHKPLLTAVVRL